MLGLAAGFGALQSGAQASPLQAATLNVPASYATIQAAITAANTGDTVLVAPGTYTGTGNVDLTTGGKDLIIRSSAGAATTIIDCQGSAASPHRGFNFINNETAACLVQGFTIQNGYGTGNVSGVGSGIRIYASTGNLPSPTIKQCIFKNNIGFQGGAIFINATSPTITQCDFIGNATQSATSPSQTYGGAIEVTKNNSSITTVNISDCVFLSNSSQGDGGALDMASNNANQTVNVYNCSFYGNLSTGANTGTVDFFNGTNSVRNCIFWGDISPKEISTASPPAAGVVTYCDVNQTGYNGVNNNISADPKYVDPANGNLHLQSSSPCIAAGTSTGAPATDHDGVAWTNNVSMGAFDAVASLPVSATTGAATAISSTGATLNGTINANGGSAAVTFDYGTSTSYSTTVAGTPSPVTGSSATAVSATIGGLAPHTTYNFRVNGGAVNGSNVTFATLNTAPTATVSLAPTAPLTNNLLTATATKGDADGDTVTLTYVWKKTVGVTTTVLKTTANSSSLTDTLNLATAGNGDKGEIISVEVTPNDSRNDGGLTSASVTVNNSAPVAGDNSATTDAGVAKDITLSANDADTDTVTYAIVDGPTHGSLNAITGNQVTYTPDSGYQGPDSFTFKANDGTVDSALATISITVNETASLVVTTTQDNAANDGQTSLREAINFANSCTAGGNPEITFDIPEGQKADGVWTIALGSALPAFGTNITLTGPGAKLLAVRENDATHAFDIFTMNTGIASGITGLTIANGAHGLSNDGTLTLESCLITGNTNGIKNNGTVTVTGSTVSDNNGFGVENNGSATLTNCTISGNTGDGVRNDDTATVASCTISGNGTGIGNAGTVNVNNTLCAGNTTNTMGTITNDGHNILSGTVASAGLDPAGLKDNGGATPTIALVSGSPAINAGDTVLTTDQRGMARPQGGADDIGAYEAVGLLIGNATVTEGNSGLKDVTLTVTLSTPLSQAVTVDYATGSLGSYVATADVDYVSASGTLNFAAGETSKDITVQVKGDLLSETLERFTVILSNATNAAILDGEGVVSINDDDALPALAVNDVTVLEGNSGTTNATFTVSLSTASGQPVTVKYATGTPSSIPATAGDDYVAVPLTTLTFAPGETSKTFTVLVNGDTVIEGNERFVVTLSAASKATIADKEGLGTIAEDDTGLTIDNVIVTEGNSGTVNANFTVNLSAASSKTVTVKYSTGALSSVPATAGSDYVATNGTLTFAPGQTSKTVTVQVNGDLLDEVNERFAVNLTDSTNAALFDGEGICTITDDDAAPSIVINDVAQSEGNAGTTEFIFTVTLSAPSGQNVTVKAATVAPTGSPATAGSDYTSLPLTSLTFAPGQTTKQITVFVNGDTQVEANEKFVVKLSGATNATIVDSEGFGTIINDDVPTLLFEDEPSQ